MSQLTYIREIEDMINLGYNPLKKVIRIKNVKGKIEVWRKIMPVGSLGFYVLSRR